jgi:hypothetical protein
MDRRKELQERQAASQGQPIEHWAQGVGNLAQQFVAGLQERGVRREEDLGRQEMATALSGYDRNTGEYSQQQLDTIGRRDPEMQLQIIRDMIKSRRDAAGAESYGPVISGDAAKNLGLDSQFRKPGRRVMLCESHATCLRGNWYSLTSSMNKWLF